MKIVKVVYRAKCDFPGCKNMATSSVCDEVDVNKKLDLCDECLNQIYQSVAKTIVPKGIKAPFKTPKKIC